MREEEQEFFISLFGGYILLILCVCAISKKHLKPKRKNLLGLRFFHLSRGEEGEEGEKLREEKQRKSNTLTRQIVIHLVRVLPGREGERKSIVFANRGKSPLFYKNNTRNRNAKREA